MMKTLQWRQSTSTDSNFGSLEGGWLRVAIPELGYDEKMLGYGEKMLGYDEKMLGYANDSVAKVVQRSDLDFAGLVGLPFLRMVRYGGDEGWFWIRSASNKI